MEATKVTARMRAEPSPKLHSPTHRRILGFLNEAVVPEDLVHQKVIINPEEDRFHEDNPDQGKVARETILDLDVAKKIIEYRDEEFPLGFRNLNSSPSGRSTAASWRSCSASSAALMSGYASDRQHEQVSYQRRMPSSMIGRPPGVAAATAIGASSAFAA